jgi:hypothetical protein
VKKKSPKKQKNSFSPPKTILRKKAFFSQKFGKFPFKIENIIPV